MPTAVGVSRRTRSGSIGLATKWTSRRLRINGEAAKRRQSSRVAALQRCIAPTGAAEDGPLGLVPRDERLDVEPPAQAAAECLLVPLDVNAIDFGQRVAERPARKPVALPPPAQDRERLPRRRPGQFDLRPHERGTFGLVVLVQPVGQRQARRVLVGLVADRGEKRVVVGHLKMSLQDDAAAETLDECPSSGGADRLAFSGSGRQVEPQEAIEVGRAGEGQRAGIGQLGVGEVELQKPRERRRVGERSRPSVANPIPGQVEHAEAAEGLRLRERLHRHGPKSAFRKIEVAHARKSPGLGQCPNTRHAGVGVFEVEDADRFEDAALGECLRARRTQEGIVREVEVLRARASPAARRGAPRSGR